jgi:hypothetical protein
MTKKVVQVEDDDSDASSKAEDAGEKVKDTAHDAKEWVKDKTN